MVQNVTLEFDNWLSPEFLENPYLTLKKLREHDPVHWNAYFSFWIATRFDDVQAIFQDRRFSSARTASATPLVNLREEDVPGMQEVGTYLVKFMQGMDPPLHTRQRQLIHKAFTPRIIERMRERTQAIVDEQLNYVREKGEFDLIADLAYPLPSTIIFELLGIPLDLREQVKKSSETISSFVSLVQPIPGQVQRMVTSLRDVAELIKPMIAERRARPQGDLFSLMVQAEENGEQLSDQEIIILVTMLLFAGHETTTNLLGNGVLALLRNPDQFALLKSDLSLVPSAIEEMLRYDSPVQMIPRFIAEDMEFQGKQLHKHERIMIGLAASGHDPEHFVEPERFDITRKQERHHSFGYGIHFCIGAPLARLESQVALTELVKQMPGLHLLSEKAEWRPSIAMRSLKSLPLAF
jgi:cytochrome P450